MRIGFIADCHIANHRRFGGQIKSGINTRCTHALESLRRAVDLCNKEEVDHLVVLGDLFDKVNIEPQVIKATRDILYKAPPTTLLVGNHDQQSTDTGDHALGPLENDTLNTVTVVERTSVIRFDGIDLLLVPFIPGHASKWLPKLLHDMIGDRSSRSKLIMGVHLGVYDDNVPGFLKGSRDAVHVDQLSDLCRQYKISATFAGNWHNRWVIEKNNVVVAQCGALCPTGFDNPGLDGYGGVIIYDVEEDSVDIREVGGPRFVKPTDYADWSPPSASNPIYASVVVDHGKLDDARAKFDTLKSTGAITDYTLELDRKKVAGIAAIAAHEARSSETAAEALNTYVEKMPLDEGVDRAEVLARSKVFLDG